MEESCNNEMKLFEDIDDCIEKDMKWTYEKQRYLLTKTAFKELKDFYFSVDESKFRNIAVKALSISNSVGTLTDLFDENDELLQTKYYSMLEEFNKKFLIDNINLFPIADLIKYLPYSIGNNLIGKEFIDAIKLDIDAPLIYRDDIIKNNKKWDDDIYNEKQESLETILLVANEYVKKSDYNKATILYDRCLNGEYSGELFNLIAMHSILCSLAYDDDIISARRKMEYISRIPLFHNSSEYIFTLLLLNDLENYNFDGFNANVQNYSLNFPDEVTITLLSEIKNRFFC